MLQLAHSGVPGGAASHVHVCHVIKSSMATDCCLFCYPLSCLQRLLAAKAVDVTTAAQLTSRKKAVRVAYSTAAELVAAAETLGVPLILSQGSRYCYSLPSTPVTQHCQVRTAVLGSVRVLQLACSGPLLQHQRLAGTCVPPAAAHFWR
jgi:hypothetical protein